MLIRLINRSSGKRTDVEHTQIRAVIDEGQGQPGAIQYVDGTVMETKETGHSIRNMIAKASASTAPDES